MAVPTDTNIKMGATCKFYLYNKDGKEIEMKGAISAFGSGQLHILTADTLPATQLSALIFVYGVEINDLLSVDYEAVSMLNVSATQELARRLIESEKTIRDLTEKNQKLEAALSTKADASDLQQIKAEIELLKASLMTTSAR